MEEIKGKPQVNTTQQGIRKSKYKPLVYTTQKGLEEGLSVARESVREFVRTLASMTWDNPYIMTAMLEIKQEGKLSII